MLARIRPGLLVVATLVAAPIAACSSDSGDNATDAATNDGTVTDSGTASGGAQGSGGSAGAANASGTSGGGNASSGSGDTGANGQSTASDGTSDGTGGSSGEAGGSSGEAGAPGDLPYANVVAVATSGDDGNYTFNVSVESADVDCSQFADWWEVVSEDGMLLYRRILEHSHTDENGTSDADAPGNTFTRSGGPVNVPADQMVIVRAHMNNLDQYNGTTMRGSVALGFVTATDLDPSFAADLESAAPQPGACLF